MNRRGMTLMELIVALTITGMMVSAGYGTFATLADRRAAAAQAASEMLRHSVARAELSRWIAGARLTIQEDDVIFRAVDGTARLGLDRVDDDVLEFFTTAHTPLGAGGTQVRLYVDRAVSTLERGLVVELRDLAGTRTERLVLVPNATGFDTRFLSGIFGQRQWVESWVSTSVLPSGARLQIVAPGEDSLSPLWQLPITVAIEGGR
jgi:prepilin-type N-terminal cleavage/methylation domain-containing protein